MRRAFKQKIARTVVVHTRDERSIKGVLVGDFVDALVLAHPELLRGESPAVSLGGEVLIPRANISFVQDPGDRQP